MPSQAAVTDRLISVEESGWQALKDLSNSFKNMKSVLVRMFLEALPEAYHSGATTMGQKGFGNLAPRDILFRLVHLYGKPTLAEVQQCLARLAAPMDRLAPVEVMLRDIEECQMFYLSDTTLNRTLTDKQSITYGLIKLSATGLYTKALERWNAKDPAD